MSDNEKRILVLEVSPDCRALRCCGEPFSEEEGMFCNKDGRYIHITEEACKKCKSPVLAGITRAEAVERMAKALHHNKLRYVDLLPWVYLDSKIKRQFLEMAEAALDALLGKEAENDK